MRTRSTELVIAVMAVVGLLVSVTAAWFQLSPASTVQGSQLGPPAVSVRASPPAAAEAGPRRGAAAVRVNRSSAVPTGGQAPPASRPVRTVVGGVGIDATVRPVGVAADGQMQLPPDPRVLGWYRYGPAPDAATAGSAVLAGHLDSRQYGLGPLVRLREVEPGDPVEVTLSDGSRVAYRVDTVTRYDQQALPDELFARSGDHTLRIITCGGDYDADAGGYQQNLVVTAVPA